MNESLGDYIQDQYVVNIGLEVHHGVMYHHFHHDE